MPLTNMSEVSFSWKALIGAVAAFNSSAASECQGMPFLGCPAARDAICILSCAWHPTNPSRWTDTSNHAPSLRARARSGNNGNNKWAGTPKKHNRLVYSIHIQSIPLGVINWWLARLLALSKLNSLGESFITFSLIGLCRGRATCQSRGTASGCSTDRGPTGSRYHCEYICARKPAKKNDIFRFKFDACFKVWV